MTLDTHKAAAAAARARQQQPQLQQTDHAGTTRQGEGLMTLDTHKATRPQQQQQEQGSSNRSCSSRPKLHRFSFQICYFCDFCYSSRKWAFEKIKNINNRKFGRNSGGRA
jgi:hypothetical protein